MDEKEQRSRPQEENQRNDQQPASAAGGGLPEGVGGAPGSRAGQGILEGEQQNPMRPLPASQRQEGPPAHLEGGPHPPATRQKGGGGAEGLREGAEHHVSRTDAQGSGRPGEAARGATGGTQQRQAMPQSREGAEMGQSRARTDGRQANEPGVGNTVGGNTTEREPGKPEGKRSDADAGVTGGTATTGDVPGGGESR